MDDRGIRFDFCFPFFMEQNRYGGQNVCVPDATALPVYQAEPDLNAWFKCNIVNGMEEAGFPSVEFCNRCAH